MNDNNLTESQRQKIYAYHKLVEHPFFAECRNNPVGSLLDTLLNELDKRYEETK